MVFSSRHKLIIFLTVLILFLSLSIRPGFRVEQHDDNSSLTKKLLTQANTSINHLHTRPKPERVEQDYLGIIDLYKQAMDADNERRNGDEILLGMAQISEEMAAQLQKSRYYYSACDYYQQLLNDYPKSPHRALALINLGKIYELHLSDKQQAVRAYRAVLEEFPNSVSGREASANLIRLTPRNEPAHSENPAVADNEKSEKAITSIRNFMGADYARVVIDLTAPVQYDQSQPANNNLSLFVRDAKLASQISNGKLPDITAGLLKEINVESVTDGVKLNLICTKLRDHAIFTLNNPYRLVIDLRGVNSLPIGETETTEASSERVPEPRANSLSFMRVLGLKVRRIVIDAGHGGHDTGAIGPNGLMEKDLVLDVALRLRALIKSKLDGIDVIMTRDSDHFVALEERTAIANAQAADLFISIHANSSPTGDANGVETYYLSINANKDELEVAARENASTARNARDLQTLLQRIVLDDKVIESRDFAEHVQHSLVNSLMRADAAASNRGVKKAPFIVLIGANMPSVLAEISFISNPQQAKALATPEYREQIAESLFDGVRHYVSTLAKGVAATNGK